MKMAAKHSRVVGPNEHPWLVLAVVVFLFFWFAGRMGLDSGPPYMAETQTVESQTGEYKEGAEPPGRPDHSHAAFQERIEERIAMVLGQIERREVKDPNVLKAMRVVPRHAFVPVQQEPYAYTDRPLAIGQGQTISQPYIVAFMTEALALDPNSRVLEIGTGSGYQAAVAAEIAREVYTIEIVESLAKTAAKRLKELGYPNVFAKAGDGFYGWPAEAPFDAIIGTAAAKRLPPALIEQLGNGGRMILPVEDESGFQHLILITKDDRGRLERKKVMPVRFVPMTGHVKRPVDEPAP